MRSGIPGIKTALDAYNAVTAVMNVTSLAGFIGKNKIAKFFNEVDNPAAKQILLNQAKNGSDDAKKILDVEAELKAYSEAKLGKGWWKVSGAGNDLASFINKTLTQKIDDIKTIWNTKYPIPDMLEGRSFFEDIMGQYRYLKSSGWEHTGDISEFFKGVDFYKGS